MSTDHYAEAEGCLATADLCPRGSEDERTSLAYAQVHATLATVQRPEPSHAATSRTIPWPPSDELRTAIEGAVADVIEDDVTRGYYCCGEPDVSVRRIARAVLDAIGGSGDGR